MKNITAEEAASVIKEWGVNCDNFVACNCRQTMYGGNPHDNSIEIGEYFSKCLKIVADIGIKAIYACTSFEQSASFQPAKSADVKKPCCDNPDIIRHYDLKERFCKNCDSPDSL